MRKTMACGLGVGAVFVAVFGSGSAAAVNEYVGMTYEKAAGSISKWGTPVIATRIGEYLPTEQCLVAGSRPGAPGKVLLDLNCNDTRSVGGDGRDHPGNSAMSPAGQKMAGIKAFAVSLSKNYARASAAGEPPSCEAKFDLCVNVCNISGSCSDELLAYLGL